jgi:hypothetical protein
MHGEVLRWAQMLPNSRVFQAGPDASGRTWEVNFLWLQTAISIRHSDSVDVKFLLASGDARMEKVVALRHPDLVALGGKTGRPITDPWCMKLAALHIQHMIETGQDMEKTLATASLADLERYDGMLGQAAQVGSGRD